MRALLLSLVVTACHPSHPTPAPAPTTAPAATPRSASDFGFYLLAMSWAPSFCCTEPTKEQCTHLPGSFAATHLTLHGLWPNFTDEQSQGKPRAWPQFCDAYDHCEKAEEASCAPGVAVPADLARLAPAYVTDGGALATHEWSKHGSCTTLDAAGYFAAELAAIHLVPGDATPAALVPGTDLARDDLQRAFGIPSESVVLGCDAKCRLTQVGFCIAKDAQDHPTGPTPCTKNVTTSDYDNGCVVRGCARVAIQTAGACD